jgi:hypothetical protein
LHGRSPDVDHLGLTLYHAPCAPRALGHKMKSVMRKLLVLAALCFLPGSLSAQTADDIIARYFAARGGLAKIKAVQSERVSGTITVGPGTDGPFLVERERPLKMHMEITVAGQTLIRVYDGKSAGWVYNPFTPNPAVQAMSAEDLRSILNEADFDGPFVDYATKGNKIEYAGKEEVEGKPAHKLKLTDKSGEVGYFYFDVATFLILKWEGTHKVGDKDVASESFFREFREVNGLKYPFLIESDSPGTDLTQKIMAEKIEVNIPIDKSRFSKPTPPAAPAASEPATPAEPAKPN